jgi:hypothetical protein
MRREGIQHVPLHWLLQETVAPLLIPLLVGLSSLGPSFVISWRLGFSFGTTLSPPAGHTYVNTIQCGFNWRRHLFRSAAYVTLRSLIDTI